MIVNASSKPPLDKFYYKFDLSKNTQKPVAGEDIYELDEEGGSHEVHWVAQADSEVRIGWIEAGTVEAGGGSDDPHPTFTHNTQQEASNFLTAGILNDKADIFSKVLTPEEQASVDGGENASVWLKLDDITSTVSSTDKSLVEKALPSGFKLNKYTDLNLYKKIGSSDATKITKCPGGKIKIALDISNEIKNKNCKIIRVHEGKAEVIDAKEENGKMAFETDEFSTYAVAYADRGVKTGDNNMNMIFIFAIIAIVGAGFAFTYRKKNR